MKIIRQKEINNKVKVTIFDDGVVQLDIMPISEQNKTIELNQNDVDDLIKFLQIPSWYGMGSNGTKPIYLH